MNASIAKPILGFVLSGLVIAYIKIVCCIVNPLAELIVCIVVSTSIFALLNKLII